MKKLLGVLPQIIIVLIIVIAAVICLIKKNQSLNSINAQNEIQNFNTESCYFANL